MNWLGYFIRAVIVLVAIGAAVYPRSWQSVESNAYWVSPAGRTAWEDARSETPLSGIACCSLAVANANAVAGDTVYLRGGTYDTGIKPAHSGSAGNVITYRAYGGEVPTLTVSNARAITIVGKSYIKIEDIRSYQSQAFFFIGSGACYNEIANCTFDHSSGQYSVGLITFYNTAFEEGPPSNHNWLHHNVFSRYGRISRCNDAGTVRISGHKTDPSSHNTFEDNIFFYGGHDNLDIGGCCNVVRDNVFHNEEAYFADAVETCQNRPVSGFFGNRNLLLSNYGEGPGTARDTLIEGNRIGYAGTPPDDDGAMGVENAGIHTVVRFNDIFGNGASGYYSKMQGTQSGSWARVYHNTFFGNGFGDESIDSQFKYGICIWSYRTHDNWPKEVVITGNIVFKNRRPWRLGSENIRPQVTYLHNIEEDPNFENPDMSDKTSPKLPDLRLRSGSRCIDRARPLTLTCSAGVASAFLDVEDAMFFQDGTWGSSLSNIESDWIAIGAVDNVVQVLSIESKNRIRLAEPLSWDSGAPVWLYRDSRGRRVLFGPAPDLGAHEYTGPPLSGPDPG